MTKDIRFNARIDADLQRKLRELSDTLGINQSAVLTVAINRLHKQEIQTMTASNPTYAEAHAMAMQVYDAAYPARTGERNLDTLAEIEEWLQGPGGWADYTTAAELATEWLELEAEAERNADQYTNAR